MREYLIAAVAGGVALLLTLLLEAPAKACFSPFPC